MDELSDEELLARYRLAPTAEASRRLLDELFRRHRAHVVSWCYRLTGDRARICEIASPANCDEATVTVTVQPLSIYAALDSGRGSSKRPNTVVASVLTNDRLGNGPATIGNVSLAFVSLTPTNSKIRLDLTDGSVDVLGKTDSGLYTMVYKICERAMPTNCAQGTVRIDLSGGL
jgi:hypothetical protein